MALLKKGLATDCCFYLPDSINPAPFIAAAAFCIAHAFSQTGVIRFFATCPVYGLSLRITLCNDPAFPGRLICAVILLFYVDIRHNHSSEQRFERTILPSVSKINCVTRGGTIGVGEGTVRRAAVPSAKNPSQSGRGKPL